MTPEGASDPQGCSENSTSSFTLANFHYILYNHQDICREEHKMTFEIKLEAFEGPLDLLLHLVEKNKVDIYDIPIVIITDQYIEYIDKMRVDNMDIMSEFLLMAATLLSIKSKMLLPRLKTNDGEDPVDPRMELIERLVEYKTYKQIAGELRDMQVDAAHVVFREKNLPKEVVEYEEPLDISSLLEGLTLKRLNSVFHEVLQREKLRQDPVRSGFSEIKKEEFTLEEKIEELMEYSMNHEKFTFLSLFEDVHSKMQIIVTFLALLELMKSGMLFIIQENINDDILIERRAA